MKVHEVVKYVNPEDCIHRFKLTPTEEQIRYLEDSARAINCLFVRLLEICEYIDDKYRSKRKKNSAGDMYLASQISNIKHKFPETKGAWASSQVRIIYKVLQRNIDRINVIRTIDRGDCSRPRRGAVKRLSEIYSGQGTCDMTGFQIPIALNHDIYDITLTNSAELTKRVAKVGKRPVIVRTTEGTKLYVPKMKAGIKIASNGLHDLGFLYDIEHGEAFAYIENYKGKYYLSIYDRRGNRFLPTTRMPKAVKQNQLESRAAFDDFLRQRENKIKCREEIEDRIISCTGPARIDRFKIRKKVEYGPDSYLDDVFSTSKKVISVKPAKRQNKQDVNIDRDADGFIILRRKH